MARMILEEEWTGPQRLPTQSMPHKAKNSVLNFGALSPKYGIEVFLFICHNKA
jgi:hypothetical protein